MNDQPGYLLDTNVISELTRKTPSPSVVKFFSETEPGALFLSALTLGEIRKGVAHKARTDVHAAYALETWAKKLENTYFRRILVVDSAVATVWGNLSSQRNLPVVDTLLAATAIRHGLTMVTRNSRDVADTGVKFYNPWQIH